MIERVAAMPFSLLSLMLGVCFALVWVYVCVMTVRLGQFSARQDRDAR
jgi:hypothetical protein